MKSKFLLLLFMLLAGLFHLRLAQYSMSDVKCPLVAIQMGNTYSRMAVDRGNGIEIIPDAAGNKRIPSVVAYTHGQLIAGDKALKQITENPKGTVQGFKALLGRSFSDNQVQDFQGESGLEIVNKDSKPYIQVGTKESPVLLSTDDLFISLLSHLKSTAEEYLSTKVFHVMITVPVQYNDEHRQLVKDYAQRAGFEVVRLVNDHHAAIAAYGLHRKQNETNILVYQFGTGLRVSVLSVESAITDTVSTDVHNGYGCQNFNRYIADSHLIWNYNLKSRKKVKYDSPASKVMLREVERANRGFFASEQSAIKIDIENFFDGTDFSETLTRAELEDIFSEMVQMALGPVQQALDDAGLKKTQIDEIILVGGGSLLPATQKVIQKYFKKNRVSWQIKPDEAIVSGAAVIAKETCDQSTLGKIQMLCEGERTPLTLGVEGPDRIMIQMIPRGTPVPVKKTITMTADKDGQEPFTVSIFEGERPFVNNNRRLAELNLTGIPKAARGVPQIEVTFDIDQNSILTVSAVNKETNKEEKITITNDKGRLSKEEIDGIIENAKRYKEVDEKLMGQNMVKRFNTFLKESMADGRYQQSTSHDRLLIQGAIKEYQHWLKANHSESFSPERYCHHIIQDHPPRRLSLPTIPVWLFQTQRHVPSHELGYRI